MSEKYFGFDGRDDVAKQFEVGTGKSYSDDFAIDPDFPTDAEILFANYGSWSYDGDAFVLFERDGKLYEVTGGHCSCYGLEGQWSPEETNWEALKIRKFDKEYFADGAMEAVQKLIADRLST